MMKCVYVILTIIQLLSIREGSARPTGAPNTTCTSLTPGHGASLNGTTPFQIDVQERTSDELRVTISSSNSTPFQGFILQARKVGTVTPLGRFVTLPSTAHTIACENDGDTVTHSNISAKTTLTFSWMPPVNFSSEIRFNATVAINKERYWRGIVSEVITFPLNNGTQSSPASSNGTQTLLQPSTTMVLSQADTTNQPLAKTPSISKALQQHRSSSAAQSQAGSMQNTSRLVFLGATSIVSPAATLDPSTTSVLQSVIVDPPFIASSPSNAQTSSIVLSSPPLETLSRSLPSSTSNQSSSMVEPTLNQSTLTVQPTLIQSGSILPSSSDTLSVAESPSVAQSSTLIDSPTVAQSPSMSQPTPFVESSSIDQTPPTTSIPFSPSIVQTTSIPRPISSTQLPPTLSTIEISPVTRQSSFALQSSSVYQTLGATVPLQTTLNQSSSMVEPTLNQSTLTVQPTLNQPGSIVPTQTGILPSTSQIMLTTKKSTTQRTINAVVSFSIIKAFTKSLENKTSQEYLDLTVTIENEVERVYKSNEIDVNAKVLSLRPGSILAELLIIFLNQQLTNTPLRPLEDAIRNNKLGNLSVDPRSLSLIFYECEPKCHQNATCTRSSTTGSFSCICDPGLTGDGIQCTVECVGSQASDQSSDEKARISLIVSLVILSLCFLLLLGMFMYQRRLLQNYKKQLSSKPQTTKENFAPDQNYESIECVEDTREGAYVNDESPYANADNVLGSDEPTEPVTSPYMSLKDTREPPNVYQPLQLPGKRADHHHAKARNQATLHQNPAFDTHGF